MVLIRNILLILDKHSLEINAEFLGNLLEFCQNSGLKASHLLVKENEVSFVKFLAINLENLIKENCEKIFKVSSMETE